MTDIKLSYFDFNGGRGEDCRLALHIGGVAFTDDRVKGAEWGGLKGGTPWGNLPVLTVDGRAIGQSNAILAWIGRTTDQHPTDPWEAARHEAVMSACEELRHHLEPSLSEKDPDRKKAMREEAAAGPLQDYGRRFEREIAGPFLAGDKLHVADLKLFVICKWLRGGVLDHIPATVWDAFPKLVGLHEAALAHPGVKSWYNAR